MHDVCHNAFRDFCGKEGYRNRSNAGKIPITIGNITGSFESSGHLKKCLRKQGEPRCGLETFADGGHILKVEKLLISRCGEFSACHVSVRLLRKQRGIFVSIWIGSRGHVSLSFLPCFSIPNVFSFVDVHNPFLCRHHLCGAFSLPCYIPLPCEFNTAHVVVGPILATCNMILCLTCQPKV